MAAIQPSINLQVKEEDVGNGHIGRQMYVVIDTKSLGEDALLYKQLVNELGKQDLEPLNIRENNEYSQHFQVNRGIAVLAKKHAQRDADHSPGFDRGITINTAFRRVEQAVKNVFEIYYFHPEAYDNLHKYVTPFKEVGIEVAIETTPELADVLSLEAKLQQRCSGAAAPHHAPAAPPSSFQEAALHRELLAVDDDPPHRARNTSLFSRVMSALWFLISFVPRWFFGKLARKTD